MANQPLNQWYRRAIQDFSGGLNNHESPLLIAQNQFAELRNALVNSSGLLEKAGGYVVDGSPFPDDTTALIRMLINYKRGTSVDKLVVAASDTGNANATYKVDYKDTSGTGTYSYIGYTTGTAGFTNGNTAVTGVGTAWASHLKAGDKIKADAHAEGTWAEISSVTNDTNLVLTANYTGATAATQAYKARIITHKDFIPQAIVFNNNLVYTNGSEKPMSYNNTTVVTLTDSDCPKGKFIAAHKSRVFIASTSGAPSSVYWSSVNDETAWDATSVEPVFPNDNGNITAIKSFADSLIVLKDNGNIYQIIGSFDQTAAGSPDFIRKIDTPENIGMIAGYTAAIHDDNRLYFLSETGIYALDSKMSLEKVSWNLQGTLDTSVLKSSAVSAKSYLYDTSTQWDTGSHSGTIARSADGLLRPYFDLFTITDAFVGDGAVSVYLDSSKNAHVAYVKSDKKSVRYKKYLATDNSISIDETITGPDSNADIFSVSLDIDGSGIAGIAFITYDLASAAHTSYRKKTLFTQRTAGTWIAVETAHTSSGDIFPTRTSVGVSLRYRSDNRPRIASCSAGDGHGIQYHKRDGAGAWTTAIGITAEQTIMCSLYLVSDGQPRIALSNFTDNSVSLHEGASGGEGALTSLETISVTFSNSDYGVCLDKTSGGNYIYSFCSGGVFKKRNYTTTTTSNLDADTTNIFKGYVIDSSDRDNFYASVVPTSDRVERATFENSLSVTNTVANTSNSIPGDRGMDVNGAVFVTATFGANANEILVRRLAYRGIWIGPETSDSTLTAWGTYDVADQSTVSSTITHEIALAASSPASAYASITSGAVISTDATLIYAIPKITFVMGAFTGPSIGSATLNYIGTGIDGKIPTGVVFDNEYYVALTESGQSANNLIALLDKERAFTTLTPPVTFMCRYKKLLYGGGSTTGKVYRLNEGFAQNSSAYTMTATTKEDLLGSIELQKEIYKAYVLFKIQDAGTFDFSYRVDNFKYPTGATWVTTAVDQTSLGIAEIKIRDGLCRSVQFKIENDEEDSEVGIIGFVVIYGFANIR